MGTCPFFGSVVNAPLKRFLTAHPVILRRPGRAQETHEAERACTSPPSISARSTRSKPPRLPRSANPLDERLSEELEFLRRRIGALGGALASDPILIARHAAALQDVDLIAQTLGHLAAIVAAADKSAAADRVSLAELRARLKRKPLMSIVP